MKTKDLGMKPQGAKEQRMAPKVLGPRFAQPLLDVHDELIVDLFAGGGGASSGIEEALGRQVDIAINHDEACIQLHKANHPQTHHIHSDVFEVDPRFATQRRPVGFMWASPDCTFHSKARGAKPIRHKFKKRRALAWVVTRWAGQVFPRVIMLENVEEFARWAPLVGARDKETGRIIKIDGTVASPGEIVAVEEQQLVPCKKRKEKSFRKWVKSLTELGYEVQWRELRACDYGAATIRKRLYLIARRDGQAIVWPEATHGESKLPYDFTANHIDWSQPMLSIFATKEEAKAWATEQGYKQSPIRPLKPNTHRRIARGVMRFVVKAAHPFLVMLAHGEEGINGSKRWGNGERSIEQPITALTGTNESGLCAPIITNVGNSKTTGRGPNVWDASEPLRTQATASQFALTAPIIAGCGARAGQSPEYPADVPLGTITAKNDRIIAAPLITTYYGEKGKEKHGRGSGLDEPLHTQTTENRHAVVGAFLTQNNEGFNAGNEGRSIEVPVSTILEKGANQSLIGVHVTKFQENSVGSDPADPLDTAMAGAPRFGVVGAHITQFHEGSTGHSVDEPLRTITSNSYEKKPGGAAPMGIVGAHMQRDFGTSVGSALDDPIGTITSDYGGHAALVASQMTEQASKEFEERARAIRMFLEQHTGEAPTVDERGFVIVRIEKRRMVYTPCGEWVLFEAGIYTLADICMRMLTPRELYSCQGFRKTYIIAVGADGKALTKTQQVHMVGNSVCPQVAAALAKANCPELIARKELIA